MKASLHIICDPDEGDKYMLVLMPETKDEQELVPNITALLESGNYRLMRYREYGYPHTGVAVIFEGTKNEEVVQDE